MSVLMKDIKILREKTGAGVMDAKKALEESKGDMKKAEEWIAKKGVARAEKKADRETGEGYVGVYLHHDGKTAGMVKLLCETDFVARTEDFQKLANELAMQVASMGAESVDELMEQAYIRDPKSTVEELVKTTTGKLGENIRVDEVVKVAV